MRRFAYRLALRLGRSNVDAMLRSMTAKQFQEWMTFAELEPFGEDREDARFGSVVQVLTNVYRNSKKHPAPYTLAACVLEGGDAFEGAQVRKPQSWQEMKMIGMTAAVASAKGKGS